MANCQGFGTKEPTGNSKVRSRFATAAGRARKRGPDAGKAAPVYATYRPVGGSCPPDCALLNAGCYAQEGNVNIHQLRAARETFDPLAWALALPAGALIRWNVSGDFVGPDGADYRAAVSAAHTMRPDLVGWSYTHAWDRPDVARWAADLPGNVRIAASLDDPTDEARARAMGWETITTVIPTSDGEGFTDDEARQVRASGALPCPAQRVKIGCADCRACARDGHIVFAVHSGGRKRANRSLAARRSLPVAS